MSKEEFLAAISARLNGLPQSDMDKTLEFYSEMIDDRVEEGMSEEDAVAAIGSVDEVVSQTLGEVSLSALVREKMKPTRALRTWEIVLLILGSPVWLPLLFAGVMVFLSLYLVVWSLIVSLYAIDFSFAVCFLAGLFGFGYQLLHGEILQALFLFGAGIACGGIAILLFFAFRQITVALLRGSKSFILWVKSCFLRKEAAK